MRTHVIWMMTALAGLAMAAGTASAATGDVLGEYRSELGTMPDDQGVGIEDNSLGARGSGLDDCPLQGPDLGQWEFPCYFFGAEDGNSNGLKDNDGTELPINNSGGGFLNHTSSPDNITPPPPPGVDNPRLSMDPADLWQGHIVNYVWAPAWTWKGVESYSEWIEFDDDGDNLEHVATLGQHEKTPKGAQNFPNAPVGYPPLRLVGGDGNGIALSLPYIASANNQEGQVQLRISPDHHGPYTLVAKVAFGPKSEGERQSNFIDMDVAKADGSGYVAFKFYYFWNTNPMMTECSDPADPLYPCGGFGVNYEDDEVYQIDDLGATPLYEFVTFRAACDADANGGAGDCQVWIGEDTEELLEFGGGLPALVNGQPKENGTSAKNLARLGLISDRDWTIWIDYIQVLEGIVYPTGCPPLTFDVKRSDGSDGSDGLVDEQDLAVFAGCATGPAPDPDLFERFLPDGVTPNPDYIGRQCACMDRNEDLAVEQKDFGYFQRCYTGSTGSPADPECDDDDD